MKYEYMWIIGTLRGVAPEAQLNNPGQDGWRVIYTTMEAGDYVILMEREASRGGQ
jgi:hypothetical protein